MSLLARGNKAASSSVPSRMPTKVAMSRGRRLAGSAALVATAAGLGAIAVHDTHWIEWSLLAFSGVLGLAGIGLARTSMVSQVLSRATAWVVLAPSILVTLVSTLGNQSPELTAAALATGSGAALLLARPMLHTDEARSQFAPISFRKWLLAGATASAAAGIVVGMVGLDALRWNLGTGVALAMLGLSLLASAVGVVRMRAWGILLGGLTSFVTLVSALFMHDAGGLAVALTAIPGLMFLLPVLIAQRERARADAPTYTRVAMTSTSSDASDMPVRMRIAADATDDHDDDLAAPAPAARTMHV